MIPDKIFLGIGPMSGDEPDKRYLYAEWYEEPKPLVKNIAYLRKDALLEWAKEREAETRDKAGTDDVACAYHDAIMDLIEKIESL